MIGSNRDDGKSFRFKYIFRKLLQPRSRDDLFPDGLQKADDGSREVMGTLGNEGGQKVGRATPLFPEGGCGSK